MIVLHRFSQMSSRLVFSLSLCALIFGIGNLISSGLDREKENFRNTCILQGWLIQFSELCIFSWITTIALNLYLVVCWNLATKKYEIIYHIAVWGWGLFAACIPFVRGTGVYDLAGIWCWFSKNYVVYRFVLFYVPFLIQVVIVLIFYIFIIRKITSGATAEGEAEQQKVKLIVHRLRAYPIIFFVLYLFPIINRIYDAVSSSDSFPLYVLQVITAPSIGFVNAIAYGDNEIRSMWAGIFRNCFWPPENVNEAELEIPSDDDISFQSEVNDTSQIGTNNE